jgi:hypothetical protein
MIRFTPRPVCLAAVLTLCLACFPTSATAQRGGVRGFSKKPAKPAQAKAPTLPAYKPAPLTPVPLDQVPAVAPVVDYKDGQLTIEAHNSTLTDVLKAVRQQTGAELEIPANATERVVADLGPGPARQVLSELLNGTHFNYVIVGSTSDPNAVQSIFLTSKSTSGAVESAASGMGRPGLPEKAPAANVPEPEPPSDDANDGAENNEDSAVDQTADQQNSQNPNQQTPKTPEQLLQELQRQQQQQQQQQQQNGQPGQPQPGQPQPGILPNQPPTAAPANPNKPE